MKSMRLITLSIFLGIIFSMIPLIYNNNSPTDFESITTYLDNRITPLNNKINELKDNENIFVQLVSGLLSVAEGIINITILIGIFVLMFFNSFITVPSLAIHATTSIEKIIWSLLSLIVIINNSYLIKEFYSIVIKGKSE